MMINKSVVQTVALPLSRFLVRRPWVLIAGVILYVIVPVDVIPEAFLGPIGYLDDLFVLLLPLVLREFLRKHDPKTTPHD